MNEWRVMYGPYFRVHVGQWNSREMHQKISKIIIDNTVKFVRVPWLTLAGVVLNARTL